MIAVADSLDARYMWLISTKGHVSSTVGLAAMVPTVYLKSDVMIESGTGSMDNPYILEIN